MNCSLGLGLEFETVLLSVSVSVSFMRPRSNKSRSRSRWQDQSVKSLGLVYKTHMASSLGLGLVFKYWSRQSVIPVDRFVILERIYFLWEELISVRNQYAQILKRFLLAFFVFCSWTDLFLPNRKDFLIPIQNATKTRDFLPIFRFNF